MSAPTASASSWYINYPDTCVGSYCEGALACYEALCIDSNIIATSFTCSEVCSIPAQTICGQLPHACEAVGVLLQTPVGTCTYAYCDWNGLACVEVDTEHCLQPHVPAACVGSLCQGEGQVCVWSDASPGGDCASLIIRCGTPADPICRITQTTSIQAGACAGNPQSYGYTNPACHGGIACVDMPATKILQTDFCFIVYTVM